MKPKKKHKFKSNIYPLTIKNKIGGSGFQTVVQWSCWLWDTNGEVTFPDCFKSMILRRPAPEHFD